jgi:rod shape determining protein RodA
MRRQVDILSNIDWLVVILYLLLITFGWLNIFAVNQSAESVPFFRLQNRYTMQLLWIVISLLVILSIFIIDSRFFSFVAYPVYGLGIFLLVSVFVVGTVVHSSKSWIVLGPVSIQPSEFAKLATMLALAKYMSGYNFKITRFRDILISLVIVFLPAVLILIQPDFGSTLVYAAFLFVLYREGLPGGVLIFLGSLVLIFLATLILTQFVLLIILGGMAALIFAGIARKPLIFLAIAAAAALIIVVLLVLIYFELIMLERTQIVLITLAILVFVSVLLGLIFKSKEALLVIGLFLLSVGFNYSVDYVFENVMQEHQRNRINVMLGLASDPYGYEYNVRQSKIAIGSGGFAGKGFLEGTQTKFRFVPEQSTDFIFCTVGEEWGFVGSFGLVIIYVSLLIRLIILAERQRSRFSRIYGYGVISVLFFHFAVNIGMTIGLFPVIGIPLPFLSYGGSSFLAFSMMLFIFIRLDASRKTYLL